MTGRRSDEESRAELERRTAELDQLEPFLELAREIRREVARVVDDDRADGELLAEAIDRIPRQERERVARAVFERLTPIEQWSVIERVFDDAEVRAFLEVERAARLDELRSEGERRSLIAAARAAHALDVRAVPTGEQLTLGLFREADVRSALRKGSASDAVARRLVLRSVEPGAFRVIEDVFNPRGGYFVTSEYDEATWRTERLASHAVARVGSAGDAPGADGGDAALEPVLYPGGRVDVVVGDGLFRGRLHLGFVMLRDDDVFAG